MKDMVRIQRPSTNHFAREPNVAVGRSQFDRSHGLKTTFDASYLYPILVDEVLPGDTFTCKLNGFARIFSPLDAPIMDNIELETFFFFVPTRLLWDNWEYFNGAHDQAGAQDTSYTIPVLATGLTVDHDNGVGAAQFAAYMGLPHGLQTGSVDVNCLPFRAYALIYNQWFRDQNIGNEVVVPTGNGPDSTALYPVKQSYKKHDYFTSALPYLQKGDAQTVAISGTANVAFDGLTGENPTVWAETYDTLNELDAGAAQVDLSVTVGTDGPLYVDLSTGSIDVNALRQSVAIQRLLEKDARGGTRYVELIKSHFGVTSPDFRLQRPEFLGGGKSYITVSAVANTSGVDSTNSPTSQDEMPGSLRGVGVGTIRGHGWAKSFVEHGYVLGLMRARGDITYFQGLDKMWTRSTRYDFYIPALANLGEQSILNKELYISNSSATDDAVFGYQERWAEYRYRPSRITGNFNPDVSGSLSHWHLAEDFASLPTLSNTFLRDQTPMSRVETVTTEPDFLLDLWFDYKCARPIPVHSIPSLTSGRF